MPESPSLPGSSPTLASAPAPAPVAIESVALARATSQLAWYNTHASRNRIGYLTIKIFQIALGAAVPVVAGLHAPAAVTGSLGAVIVVLEGIQQLFQFHENWLRYRVTAMNLAREINLYDARVAPFAAEDRATQLAARVENITSAEASAWARESKADPSPAATAG
jgi:hypothetical protein